MQTQRLIGNRYELGDLVGQGGMGAVFRGRDTRTGQAVALKELRRDVAELDTQMLERFEREAEALRRLGHPGIVKMLDMVEEGGRRFLVMEYVPGGLLEDLLRRQGPLTMRRALEIALDLADALARVHRLQIVHRDLKPANVLLAEDGTPRLTDFGAAYVRGGSRLTETGVMIGTFAYLSPEVCEGVPPDARADLWAFGVLLFEMLAGRRPFEERQTGALLTAILTRPAPDLRALRPDVSPALAELVAQLLEKDRERRIGSARLVGATLEALLRAEEPQPRAPAPAAKSAPHPDATPDSATIEAPALLAQLLTAHDGSCGAATATLGAPRPATATRDAPQRAPARPATRPPWLALALIALITFAALGSAALALRPAQAPRTTSLAPGVPALPERVAPVAQGEHMVLVAQLEQLGRQPRDEARFIADTLRQAVEVAAPFSRVRVRSYPRAITSDAEARAAAEANGAPLVVWGNDQGDRLEVNVQVGDTRAFPGIALERRLVEQVANVRLRLSDARRQSVAPYVLGALSMLQNADGDAYETVRTIAIMAMGDAEPAEPIGASAATHYHRATALFASDTAAAIAELDQAIALSGGNPILYTSRGLARQRAGQLDEARRDIETARRLGPEGWAIPPAMLASDAALRGDVRAAVSEYDRIVALRPGDWFPRAYRGALLYLAGDRERARVDLERSIALGPDANYPYALAALIALREGRLEDAAALADTIVRKHPDPELASRIMAGVFGSDAPSSALGPLLASLTSLAIGQHDRAVAEAEAAQRAAPGLADAHVIRGVALCSLGRYEEAVAAYGEGLADSPDDALLRLLRADSLRQLGDTAGSEEDLEAVARSSALAPHVEAVRSGSLTCQTLLGARP